MNLQFIYSVASYFYLFIYLLKWNVLYCIPKTFNEKVAYIILDCFVR